AIAMRVAPNGVARIVIALRVLRGRPIDDEWKIGGDLILIDITWVDLIRATCPMIGSIARAAIVTSKVPVQATAVLTVHDLVIATAAVHRRATAKKVVAT